MEVDRIWRIDGLDSHANPAWQNSAQRRRRFVEEVPPAEGELEASEEGAADQAEADQQEPDRQRGAMADDNDAAETPSEPANSFRAIA